MFYLLPFILTGATALRADDKLAAQRELGLAEIEGLWVERMVLPGEREE